MSSITKLLAKLFSLETPPLPNDSPIVAQLIKTLHELNPIFGLGSKGTSAAINVIRQIDIKGWIDVYDLYQLDNYVPGMSSLFRQEVGATGPVNTERLTSSSEGLILMNQVIRNRYLC